MVPTTTTRVMYSDYILTEDILLICRMEKNIHRVAIFLFLRHTQWGLIADFIKVFEKNLAGLRAWHRKLSDCGA